MQGCEIPIIIPYKTLMSHIRHVQINEVLGLEILVERLSNEAASEVYRPIKPLLLRLADLNLLLREKKPCLHWFNEEKSLFYVAVGADGAPFWKSDTATRVYLVSLINLLQRVQSCNDNHLLLVANCEEDHVLLRSFSSHLAAEMKAIKGKPLTTPRRNQGCLQVWTNTSRYEMDGVSLRWVE